MACVNELLLRALYTTKPNARYAYIAPYYSQAKQAAWTYLKEAALPFVTSFSDIRESDLQVTLINGASVRLFGADNPDALRGTYFDGVILDEFGDCRPSLWGEVILPTLADRQGWAVFIGTPKGKNHFYDIYERSKKNEQGNWFSLTLKASTSGIIPQSELREIQQQQTDEEYNQEFECDFAAAVLGTYYASTINMLEDLNQIQPDHPAYDPSQPVHVAADLGYKDSTSLWFWQHAPDGISIIDYEEHSGQPLAFYFDLLDDKPYKYEKIWLPHDARAKTLQTGRSTVEQFMEPPNKHDGTPRKPYPVDITPNLKKQQGIDAARMVLPHCHFNQGACYAGIESLRSYKRKYDEIRKVFSTEPLHDWASDGADAFRYLALVAQTRLPIKRAYQRETRIVTPPGYSLDELFEDREDLHKYEFERARI